MPEPQYRARVLATKCLPGTWVDLVESDWDPGADIVHLENRTRLMLRLKPDRLQAVGIVPNDLNAKFGRLLVRRPNTVSRARAGNVHETASVLHCRFDPSWVQSLVGARDQWCAASRPSDLDLRNVQLGRTMRRLAAEIAAPSLCSDTMIDALASSAAIDLFRHFLSENERRQLGDNGALGPDRLRRVREYVEFSLEKTPTISAISHEMGISASHLRRLFKNSTGQTLHNYIEETRIAQAQDLLSNTRLPLKVISYKLGFSHPSAFSAAYRKATGESPREYRNRAGTLAYPLH